MKKGSVFEAAMKDFPMLVVGEPLEPYESEKLRSSGGITTWFDDLENYFYSPNQQFKDWYGLYGRSRP